MSDQPQPAPTLNAAQIDTIQKRMISEFQRAVDDVEMRKQAVDAAVKVIGGLAPGMIVDVRATVDLAREIYAFMAEPATEIVVKVT
jgi:hypothetical protein